jgi:hypothetical protein
METAKPMLRRCPIYTRRSSEEGLEQNFNSLHAQREACVSFSPSALTEASGHGLHPWSFASAGVSTNEALAGSYETRGIR